MTRDEAAQLIIEQGCTPELYAIVEGKPWNGKTRFIWLKENLDIGYRIRQRASRGGSDPNPASDRQRQPWLEQGVSQATYYRRRAANAKWAEIFLSLNAIDTPPNRLTYSKLAKASELMGKPVSELWSVHIRTLTLPLESVPSLSLSSDNNDNDTLHGSLSPLGIGEHAALTCPVIGPCEACHAWHLAPFPLHDHEQA